MNTKEQQEQMLRAIGVNSIDDLFSDVPADVRLKKLDLPEGVSEMEAYAQMEQMADRNRVYRHIFRGAGAYNHYIPAIVSDVTSKEEFRTAYTPYQAEINQGVLQSIFEYQTMMCQLTGMDVSNASVYDGASAAAEAAAMCRDRKRGDILISAAVNPEVMKVVKTYAFGSGANVIVVPEKAGKTDLDELKKLLTEKSACFYIQQPNYFGIIEDAEEAGKIAHEAGAKYIIGSNPIADAILETPGECGADIACGEGQPLGLPLSFGGPYLGFMTCTVAMMRKLPGRIVGRTSDAAGNPAYVLTLQAREQHIRREKAGSNICSNEALCAMTAGVYMAAMGEKGMQQVARLCLSKAHYLAEILEKAGLRLKYDQPFFHEFVTVAEGRSEQIENALDAEGILGGLPLSEDEILWCATEKNTKAEMDKAAAVVKEVLA